MSGSITVTGTAELVEACERVAALIGSTELATAAADLVAGQANPRVPRRTGRLAASVTTRPTGTGAVQLAWTAPHAAPVHKLRPWLPQAVVEADPAIRSLYDNQIHDAWR